MGLKFYVKPNGERPKNGPVRFCRCVKILMPRHLCENNLFTLNLLRLRQTLNVGDPPGLDPTPRHPSCPHCVELTTDVGTNLFPSEHRNTENPSVWGVSCTGLSDALCVESLRDSTPTCIAQSPAHVKQHFSFSMGSPTLQKWFLFNQ